MFTRIERILSIQESPGFLYTVRKIWHPEWFQGYYNKKTYFEGWYFKIVSQDGKHRYAIIPGITTGKDAHAFIQIINGNNGNTVYHRFLIEDFKYSTKDFEISIGYQYFSRDRLHVDVGKGEEYFYAHLDFQHSVRYPVKFHSPGIMGWYRFVPFMECFHGVVSMHHTVQGVVKTVNDVISIQGGRGYIEKDWGLSMPKAWVWMQTNSFQHHPKASFMLSVAHIPWLGSSFTGFLGFLYDEPHLYSFATYLGARISDLSLSPNTLHIVIDAKTFSVHIEGTKGTSGALRAPQTGDMTRIIHESIDASLRVTVKDKENKILFKDSTHIAGLELVGDPNHLKP
ncbi:tocopherol cyclase family protein [Fidelibacter multiformis]|jgi:hypothetical protein|uniref:tocopherol cyclase family protein n=1 Tax=Fidelibacter multiformis TaxID=3377529 RepID=UPI0037DC08FC